MDKLIAAGLAVKARDTGRVLMLQRATSEDDPASGMFEFPGGHIEDGESPLTAAKREWREETGASLPRGTVIGEWTSAIYKGFVWEIAAESLVQINKPHGQRRFINPDDPDGDWVEVSAWWDPQLIKANPSMRWELRQSMAQVQKAIGGGSKQAAFPTFAEIAAREGQLTPKTANIWLKSLMKAIGKLPSRSVNSGKEVFRGAVSPAADAYKGLSHASLHPDVAAKFARESLGGQALLQRFKVDPKLQQHFTEYGLLQRLGHALHPADGFTQTGRTLQQVRDFIKANPVQSVARGRLSDAAYPSWMDHLPLAVRSRFQSPGSTLAKLSPGERVTGLKISPADIFKGLTHETGVAPQQFAGLAKYDAATNRIKDIPYNIAKDLPSFFTKGAAMSEEARESQLTPKTAGEPSREQLYPVPAAEKAKLRVNQLPPPPYDAGHLQADQLAAVNDHLHGAGEGSPRLGVAKAMAAQASRPPEYRSPVGMSLLHRRNPNMPTTPTNQPFLSDRGYRHLDGEPGYASAMDRQVYVSPKPARVLNTYSDEQTYDKEQRLNDNMSDMGYATIANHELSHLRQPLPGYSSRELDRAVFADESSIGATNAWRGEWNLKKRPDLSEQERLRLWRYIKNREEAYETQKRNYGKYRSNTLEVAPAIGDAVFMGEQFAREQGKPLQHTVKLPGNVNHDINWMRDQAKEHGYWDGRSMDNLIFETPEGRQWFERMLGNPKKGSVMSVEQATIPTFAEIAAREGQLTLKTAGEPTSLGPVNLPKLPDVSHIPQFDTNFVNNRLHGYEPESPRGQVATAVRSQAVEPPQYRSPVGMSLLHRRNPSMPLGRTNEPFSPTTYGPAYASQDLQRVYVRPSPLPVDADMSDADQNRNMNTAGYASIANHELSHLQQREDSKAMSEVDAAMQADKQKLIADGGADAHKYDDMMARESLLYDRYDESYRKARAYDDYRSGSREVAPVIGDAVFMGEQFAREQGKPLQHTVKLPGNVNHDINWMRDQAKEHGYWDGRSMDNLIFETPEGRQWFERMLGNPKKGSVMSVEQATIPTFAEIAARERQERLSICRKRAGMLLTELKFSTSSK